jgi:SAM-dependent methyltransferase
VSDRPIRMSDGQVGYLHILIRKQQPRTWRPRPVKIAPAEALADYSAMAARFAAAGEKIGAADRLAADLGVLAAPLRRFGCGWSFADQCWTFPLFTPDLCRVAGIVRRYRDGGKFLFSGHKAGLYAPADLPSDLSAHTLLICEGASDGAAGLDMGYWSVGRFNCQHGAALLVRLIRDRRPARVVVVADTGNDHECRGAESLASTLSAYHRDVRLIAPLAKDLRAWRLVGATTDDLHNLIEAAAPRRLKVSAA